MPTLTLKGDMGGVLAALRRVGDIGRNPRSVLDAVGTDVVRHTHERMNRGVDPTGQPWRPLSPGYAAFKEGPGILRGPNYSTTGLWGSIRREVRGNSLLWGSHLPYALIHQKGGVIKPKNKGALKFFLGERMIIAGSVTIPARPYLGFTEQDRVTMIAELEGYLERAMLG